MTDDPTKVTVDVNQFGEGELSIPTEAIGASIWGHIKSLVLARGFEHKSSTNTIRLSWPDTLTVVREFGTKSAQANYSFRLNPTPAAKEKLAEFSAQVRAVRELRSQQPKEVLTEQEIKVKLADVGFTKHRSFEWL